MRSGETLRAFGIREVPADILITDFVGLVIQPDATTIRRSYALAASLLPPAADVLAPGSLPHITLAQCPLRAVPRERLFGLVERLEAQLVGLGILLGAVMPFGAGFVFWCVEPGRAERAVLQRAHELALTIAEAGLDPSASAAVVEATRAVMSDDPVLVANARAYGYALAGDRYLPHITLGFDPRGLVHTPEPLDHVMTVERVVVARMGPRGRVDRVLSLS